ncbi:MAG: Flp family type IVb pilin [Gammaproteobacteria bacterium]
MLTKLIRFLKEEDGLTTVEYAIAGGLIGLAVVGAFKALGLTVGGVITDIDTCISGGACP